MEKEDKGSSKILAVGGYDQTILSGLPSLVVREFSARSKRKLFEKITELARDEGEIVICRRIYNNKTYEEFKRYCYRIYLDEKEMPLVIRKVKTDLIDYLRSRCLIYGLGHFAIGIK